MSLSSTNRKSIIRVVRDLSAFGVGVGLSALLLLRWA